MPRFFPGLNGPVSMNGPQSHSFHRHHGYDPNQPRIPAGHQLILFTWLSSRNGPDEAAVLAYPVSEYRRSPADKPERVWVGRLTEDKLKEACPEQEVVQGKTNKAAGSTNRAQYRNAAEYGTAVHTKLRDLIREYNRPNLRT